MPMARAPSVADALVHPKIATAFDPFQAMRLLELLANDRPDRLAPENWIPFEESFRYRTNVTLARPPARIAQIIPPETANAAPVDDDRFPEAFAIRQAYQRKHSLERPGAPWRTKPTMVGNFFGLFGPNGSLPILYTRKLLELTRDSSSRSIRTAFRDWLDLFNHRFAQLLFRAWEKYRFTVPHQRRTWRRPIESLPAATDRFSSALFSLVGTGTPPLRDRIGVFPAIARRQPDAPALARIDDRILLRHVGSFARRRAGAHELRAILEEYFGVACRVRELVGQWLMIPPTAQTKLDADADARLGVNVVAGERVWDYSSKFRLELGPMSITDFIEFLPDPTPVAGRKAAMLLAQLTRLYVGMELDFDIRLILRETDVPRPQMQDLDESEMGMRLGWNVWIVNENGLGRDADDLVFEAPCEPILA